MSLLFAAVPSPATAQNLFANPDFDDGLAPWTSYISPAGELASVVGEHEQEIRDAWHRHFGI